MRTTMLTLALVGGGAAAAAQVTDAAIQAAIDAGLRQDVPGVIEVGSKSTGQFSIQIAGPLGRVAAAAARAQRDGETFTRKEVTDDMVAPAIVQIVVYPNDPEFGIGRIRSTPAATQIVVRARGSRADPPQAQRVVTFPIAWSNGLGARVDSQGVIAEFERSALPAGDFDVVVQTADRELRYRVRAGQIAGIR